MHILYVFIIFFTSVLTCSLLTVVVLQHFLRRNWAAEPTRLWLIQTISLRDFVFRLKELLGWYESVAALTRSAVQQQSVVLVAASWIPVNALKVWEALNVQLKQHFHWLILFFLQSMMFSPTLREICLEAYPVWVFFFFFSVVCFFFSFFSFTSPRTRAGSFYRPPEVYWSCCWVTRGITVWLLVIDFQRAPITFPHNGCHYLFSIRLQLGFHLAWFLLSTVASRFCSTFNSKHRSGREDFF